MVFLNFTLRAVHKKQLVVGLDHLRLNVRGGAGGQGYPRYGGTGGRGGHVYVMVSDRPNWSLKQLKNASRKKTWFAGCGEDSKRSSIFARAGVDVSVPVPPGVVVYSDEGQYLGEVNLPEEKLLVARGGPGGNPQNGFKGQKVHTVSIRLDHRLIADVGLLGFPNAGKSTLIRALSNAKPKVAEYPFTTLRPQLGMMEYEDQRQISVADLPGLIEGAHINKGKGHHFLKHVIRTKLLLFVVDIQGFQLGPKYPQRSALETILLLNKELELYKEDLSYKPAVLALNKIDISRSDALVNSIIEQVQNLPDEVAKLDPSFQPENLIEFDDIIPISASKKMSTEKLKERLRDLLDFYAERAAEQEKVESQKKQSHNAHKQLHEHFSQAKLV